MDSLTATLGLVPGDLVAQVGAGDLTGVVRRLVLELRTLGRRVVSTATVPTRPLTGVPDHPFLIEADPAQRLARLPVLLAAAGHVRVAAETLRPDKIRGVAPAEIAPLRAVAGLDHLLVEADGARHRALKAPAAHEPALPPDPTVVLICADLAALGAPLDEAHVHRPAGVQALTGLAAGAPLTVAAIATVLTAPAGGLQGIPATARHLGGPNRPGSPHGLARRRIGGGNSLGRPTATGGDPATRRSGDDGEPRAIGSGARLNLTALRFWLPAHRCCLRRPSRWSPPRLLPIR